ncbi:ParB N-terminal domain-containing protein [Radicibacter daui]|uniref:ParB N-terminal domain-containing protein n=1 Tax=Radicibacter daui TaxID=3064829 RepID=UPI004046EF83
MMPAAAAAEGVVFLDPWRLRRHEEHDAGHARALRERMLAEGRWTVPLIVERDELIVMDGHHRLSAAREAGFSLVPCLLAGYDTVGVVSRRPEIAVSPRDIRERARCGRLYPPKTTRHILPQELAGGCDIGLERLCRPRAAGLLPMEPAR